MIITVGKREAVRTVQEALILAERSRETDCVIQILPGKYEEKIEIRRAGLTIEGIQSPEDTVLTFGDYAYEMMPDGMKRGTFRSYTMLVDAPAVTLRNLTIENSAGPGRKVGQGIALYAEGEGIRVENCRLLGSQDTLFTGPLPPKEIEPGGFRGPKEFSPRINGRQYYKDCYICGGVDFIFGSATAYFEDCVIESLPEGGGYVTAASTPEGQEYGYVFRNCRFISREEKPCVYLGRPWRDYAKTVLLNCYLGSHILPEGWQDWGKQKAHETSFYAEYASVGPGAAGSRAKWAHILTDEEAAHYSREEVLGF